MECLVKETVMTTMECLVDIGHCHSYYGVSGEHWRLSLLTWSVWLTLGTVTVIMECLVNIRDYGVSAQH